MTRLVRFSNNAVSRLAANITNASTTISLTPGDGAKFPVISGTQFFMATLIKSTGETEIVKVTARATDTLTVVRAAEPVGATQVAYAFSAGDRIEQRLTAKALSDELDRLDSGANIGATNKTADYTVQAADVSTLIRVDTTAGAITITLPEIASLADDFDIMVAKVTDNANAVNIVRAGSTDLINGATSYPVNNQWQSAWLIADRSTNTWTAINSGAATSTIAVDTFTGDGTAGPYTLSGDPVSKANTSVYLSGVYQQKATYTLAGTSLTMGGNVPVGVTVEVVWSRPLSIGRTDSDLVTYDGGTVQDVLDAVTGPNGAASAGFDWAVIPAAINKIDWGIRTAARGQNVLRWIPPSEWSAIFDGTSAYDATAAIQSAIDAKGEAWLPGDGAYKITAPIVVGFGQKLRSANARIVQYTSNTPIVSISSSKWEVTGLRLEYATQQGASDTSAMGVTFNGAFEGEFTNCVVSKSYKGFGVSVATSFAYQCTFKNIRVIDAYDWGVAFDLDGSIGLTTNTFDNVYVLQTSVGTASPQSKGFLIQYHTGGLVMRNCATDKLLGGVLLFLKGCSGAVVDVFYGEANTIKAGSGLLHIDSCVDVNVRGYLPWSNIGALAAGQTASLVRITGSSRGIKVTGRENGTNTTGNAGTIYGIDCNSTNAAISVDAREFVSDSGFTRLDALIAGSYYQIASYNGQTLQEEVLGRRVQYRSAVPASGTWAQGDTVVNSSPSTSSPIDKWRCIIAGTPGTWRPFSWTVLRGASAARPTLGSQDIGVTYLDNTLDADGKPIWWNGSAWVDAIGTTV